MQHAVAVAAVVLVAAGLLVQASTGADGAATQARVTIFARPTVVGWAQPATLYGSAAGASHDDVVVVESKDCGSSFFRTFVELHPNPGGGWTTPAGTGITSTFRAAWRGARSAEVTIRQRANVSLERRRSGSGYLVAVSARRSFWRKRVEIQRREAGGWRTVRTVVLADSVRSTGRVSSSQATFRLPVPKGTQLRARVPLAQARPCYAESFSRPVRA